MLSHNFKICASIAMSLLAIIMYFALKGENRKGAMFGMLLSTLGDMFMVDAFGLGDISLYPGAAFFMISHVVYGTTFVKASKKKGYEFKNKGFKLGIVYVLVLTVVLEVLGFTVPDEPVTSMAFLLLIYIALITFNLLSQFSYGVSEGGQRLMLIPAMALFLFSDFVIFLNMLAVTPAHNDLVWFTYIPAQVLIILFNDKFEKA